MDREDLLRRYRRLVDVELPERARRHGWVLRQDHCFGRVLLDHAVGACWYTALDRRGAAYRQLSVAQLAHAVATGERVLAEGDPLLRELNAQSLAWRRKPARQRPPAPAPVRSADLSPVAAPVRAAAARRG